MMSASKSLLESSIVQGLLARQPLTYVARGTDDGTDTGRDTDTGREMDSKPGGSDRVTDEILVMGESSSIADSFRVWCISTGAWIGAGSRARRLLSCVS